ncbi:MAG: hypothetical protein J1D89_03700 [Agathobacter sp.]|nr:hypothetical protein [Agathobacter sp.]
MKYRNAAEILPRELLEELQSYIEGELLYIPKATPKKEWGTNNGSKAYYLQRNQKIREKFLAGADMEELAVEYGLALNTIHKIIYE